MSHEPGRTTVVEPDARVPEAVEQRSWWRRASTWRRVAIAVWVLALTVQLVRSGVPTDRFRTLIWAVTAMIAFSIGRRAIWSVVVDFVPMAAVLTAWAYLRGAAESFGNPTLWTTQIHFDRWLFGVEPTVWLQAHLRYSTPRWWDAPISLVYVSFFLVPTGAAAVLWLRSRRAFYRWMVRYVAISFLGFAVFALMPAAPPWAAARCTAQQVADGPSDPPCMHQSARTADGGLLGPLPDAANPSFPYVRRTSTEGLEVLHLHVARRLVDDGAGETDLVAGVPSLHAGLTMLFAMFMWPRMRRWWKRLLVLLYPLAMAFTIMYTGDHYFFDVVVGWAFAALVAVVAGLIERRTGRHVEEAG